MKLKGALLLIAIAALASAVTANASTANTASFRGIVVGKQHGLLLVATPSGLVRAVRGHASIGSRLDGLRVVGHATRARIHGIVVKRVGSTMFLSSNTHLLAVHMGRGLASNAPNPNSIAPANGTVVNTTVDVNDNGELDEQSEDTVGQVNGNVQVQATITNIGNGTVTLSVNGQSLTVNLPAGLTLPASLMGQTVTINVDLSNGQGDDQSGGDDNGGDNGGSGGDD